MGRTLGALGFVTVVAIVLYALTAGGVDPARRGPLPPSAEPETTPPTAGPFSRTGRSDRPAPGVTRPPGRTAFADQVRITGRVTDVDSKKPIAGAVVRVLGSGVVTRTCADGTFSLVTRCGGTETVRVEAAGCPFAMTHLDLRSRSDVPPLRIALKVGAVVRGRVLDSRETPVAGAPVFEACNPDRVVTTGSDGRFALAGVRTHYPTRLRVKIAHHLVVDSEVLDLGPGEVYEKVLLRVLRAGRITGVVTDAVGNPAVGVKVQGTHAESNSRVATRTDAAGGFVLKPLGPGAWTLRASRRRGQPVRSPEVCLAEGEVREGIRLRFGWLLRGRVVNAAGKPVPGCAVHVRKPNEDRRFVPRGSVRVDMNGRFRVEVPWAREYELWVHWPRRMAETGPMPIAPGAEDVVVRLPESVAIGGTVVGPDGKASASFEVLLERIESGSVWGYGPRMFTGKDGRFRLNELPPGRWRVVVAAPGVKSDPVEMRLEPGEKVTDLRFEMR